MQSVTVNPGTQSLLIDLDKVKERKRAQVLAASFRESDETRNGNSYAFTAKSPVETDGVSRVLLPAMPKSVTVDGKQVGKDVDFPKDMGIIIETPGFIPYYSGYKNLKLLAGLNNKIGKDEIKSSMKQVGLDPELKRHVRKYSLGMRQRLGLAQAIMENPKILILDEPFNGLDKDGVKEMREYLLSYKEQGKTILICSHSAEDISVLCDTVHEMDKGVIEGVR